jgi:hypothetical protein
MSKPRLHNSYRYTFSMVWPRKILFNPPFLWKYLYQVRAIAVFSWLIVSVCWHMSFSFPFGRLLGGFVITFIYCWLFKEWLSNNTIIASELKPWDRWTILSTHIENLVIEITSQNCENRNDPDLVQAFLMKWWVESDFKAPNLPLSLRFKGSGCHCNSVRSSVILLLPLFQHIFK